MRPAFASGALLAAAALALPGLAASQEPAADGDDVGRQIDDITKPPPYDWLREPRRGVDDVAGDGKAVKRSGSRGRPRRAREGGDEGACDYRPEPQGRPGDGPGAKRDEARGPGEGCGAGESPGASGPVTAPADEGGGCDGDRGGGCGAGEGGCDRDPGGCACDRQVGSCGCGGLGRVVTPAGYLFAALALGLLVLLVVRAILRRERKGRDSEIGAVAAAESPEQVRVSQVANVPAETMLDKARAAAARGDYRAAVGWAYLAGLAALHRSGFVDLAISTTNLRVVDETRRRGGPHGTAARLVRVFEDLFFGARPATDEHWRECLRMVEEELGTLPAHRL